MGNTPSHTPSSRSKPLATPQDLPPPYTLVSNNAAVTPSSSRRSSRISRQSSRPTISSRRHDTQPISPVEHNSVLSTDPFLSSHQIQNPRLTNRRGSRNNSLLSQDREDQLQLLKKFDTVIVVDDSSSMEGALWFEAKNALAGIANLAARYDTNGIDVHFLNSRIVGMNLKNAANVESLFNAVQPQGITPTGEKLEELLLEYLSRYEDSAVKPKPVNFLILTDGAPSDDPESVIVTAARRLDAQNAPLSQVGIQFVQIGTDTAATEALREMDDELSNHYNIRDMVDTIAYTGQAMNPDLLSKILLGGINRRVDRVSLE